MLMAPASYAISSRTTRPSSPRNSAHLSSVPHCTRNARADGIGPLRIVEAAREHHNHIWRAVPWIDDGSVVADARDVAGLVQHARAGRKPGRDHVVEFLRGQRLGREAILILAEAELVFRELAQQDGEVARRRHVRDAGVVGFLI